MAAMAASLALLPQRGERMARRLVRSLQSLGALVLTVRP
jgi:hypothetical protein